MTSFTSPFYKKKVKNDFKEKLLDFIMCSDCAGDRSVVFLAKLQKK
jgi:hypothetical protein